MNRLRNLACLILTVFHLASLDARTTRVVVNASAEKEFLEASKDKSYHTFHFYKGRHYTGSMRDKSLSEVTFEDVAQTAAQFLGEQNYYPATSTDTGDLLIMISWGSTTVDADPINTTGMTGIADESAVDMSALNSVPVEAGDPGMEQRMQSQAQSVASASQATGVDAYVAGGRESFHFQNNIDLLGFDKGLYADNTHPTDLERFERELRQVRYFIVLVAFDYDLFRATKELKVQWTCRMSTRSLGTNFANAVHLMNKAAAPTFGKDMQSLQTPRVDLESDVEIGDLEVLGTEN